MVTLLAVAGAELPAEVGVDVVLDELPQAVTKLKESKAAETASARVKCGGVIIPIYGAGASCGWDRSCGGPRLARLGTHAPLELAQNPITNKSYARPAGEGAQ